MQDNGCLVNDVAKQHGRKQMIMTPNSILLPLVTKNGLMNLEHYHSTAKQMHGIDREEFMTSQNEWDPSKLDDIEGTADLYI